jgi:hypothetical protein
VGTEEFREAAEKNLKAFAKVQPKQIMTTCAGCYKTFKQLYPQYTSFKNDVAHTVLYLERLIQEGKLKFKDGAPMKVAYHDPCDLGRHAGIYDEPREIIRKIAPNFVEPRRTRENAFCCGAGRGTKEAFPQLASFSAKNRLDEVRHSYEVDMDKNPFIIDRSEKPVIDLLEPENVAQDDFSGLSYTRAFDKMIDKFSREYAWTELKKIDWAAKVKQFRPLFEKAEADKDPHAYALALRDFIWSIPDTHLGFDWTLLYKDFQAETSN